MSTENQRPLYGLLLRQAVENRDITALIGVYDVFSASIAEDHLMAYLSADSALPPVITAFLILALLPGQILSALPSA